jgi:hypothetical protein
MWRSISPSSAEIVWPSSAAASTAASAKRSGPLRARARTTVVRRRAAGYSARRTGVGIRSSIVTLTWARRAATLLRPATWQQGATHGCKSIVSPTARA